MLNILFFAWTLAYIAVTEYLTHRRAMHSIVHRPYYLYKIGHEHRIHHSGSIEPEYTTISAIKQVSIISPVLLLFCMFQLYSFCCIMVISITLYCKYWNQLHAAFHNTGGQWCKKIPWYEYQCRHHLTHHSHPKYNFSGIFAPLLDVICRTQR